MKLKPNFGTGRLLNAQPADCDAVYVVLATTQKKSCPVTQSIPSHSFDEPEPVTTLATSEYWDRSTPDDLRREIARRIADPRAKEKIAEALSSERLEFKILWNRSLVINQLPNELLIQILAAVPFWTDKLIAVTSSRNEICRPSFWRLMGVCQHWREVIVGTPAFWCLVHLGNRVSTEWTELCLARSAMAPVNVVTSMRFMPFRIQHCQAVYPLVQDRIRKLCFHCSVPSGYIPPDLLAALPPLFGDGMPELENLDVSVVERDCLSYDPTVDIELNCHRFPRLRDLALTGLVAPQQPALYRQLRSLFLHTCAFRFSCDRFLDVLASCTKLERLYLCNTLHHLTGDWAQRAPVPWRPLISLPQLKLFWAERHGAILTSRFLAQFHLHPSVRLIICARAEDAADVVPPRARDGGGPRSMAAMLPPSLADTLEMLAMPTGISMRMGDPPSVDIASDKPLLGLNMTLYSYRGRFPPFDPWRWGSVADLVCLLGRAPLTSLTIHDVAPDAVAAWASVFRTFALLERLNISGLKSQSLAGMVNAFLGLHAASAGDSHSAGTDSDADGARSVACPRLARVTIACRCYECPELFEEMQACFRYRRDRGALLADLDLGDVHCGGARMEAASSRACVRDLAVYTERITLPKYSSG